MKKIIFLVFLYLFIIINADTESIKFMNNVKEEAKSSEQWR